jgi:hypothetical protein
LNCCFQIQLAALLHGQRSVATGLVAALLAIEVGRCRFTVLKLLLKALGIKYDKVLSTVAFKFNMRRHIEGLAAPASREEEVETSELGEPGGPGESGESGELVELDEGGELGESGEEEAVVGRCMLIPTRPQVDRDCFQRLKLKHDEPLSNVAFNFNLRRYTVGWARRRVHQYATSLRAACEAGAYTRPLFSST